MRSEDGAAPLQETPLRGLLRAVPRALPLASLRADAGLLQVPLEVRDAFLDVDQHLFFVLHYFRLRVRAATSAGRVVSNVEAEDGLRMSNVFYHILATPIEYR